MADGGSKAIGARAGCLGPFLFATELWSDTMARDDRWLELIRLNRWLEARYARRGWRRLLVWVEDFAVGLVLALVAVLMSRAC